MNDKSEVFISYAQNQEDVLLWRMFNTVSKGFYVDVGAAHPEWESVTKAFYDRGWSGINIDPNPYFYEHLNKVRIRDINICALVGNSSGERNLNIVGQSGLSTACSESTKLLAAGGHKITSIIKARIIQLDDIFKKNNIKEIHFLKIDVEGMEMEVLQGCSFLEFRPKVLVIEATLPETNIKREDGMREYLENQSYIWAFFDGINDYFIANEHKDLSNHLLFPVNVLDHYHRASDIEYGRRMILESR